MTRPVALALLALTLLGLWALDRTHATTHCEGCWGCDA